MKFMIWLCADEEDEVYFFKDEIALNTKISELLERAEKECNEGQYPHWVNEFVACKIVGEIEHTPYGLAFIRRNFANTN